MRSDGRYGRRAAPLLAALALLPAPGAAIEDGSPGYELAVQVMRAVGGQEVWNDTSWDLAFDFVVARDGKEMARYGHRWIRATNAYSVTGVDKEGKPWRVDFTDVFAKKGTASVAGAAATGEKLTKLLVAGYGRMINDTYWLLMPFKLLDAGVYHERLPDTTLDGRRYLVLALSFDHVGPTPGDRYRLYIDPTTKLVERWHYDLESGRSGEYLWENYRSFQAIKLPLLRRTVDGSSEIRFENVQVGSLK